MSVFETLRNAILRHADAAMSDGPPSTGVMTDSRSDSPSVVPGVSPPSGRFDAASACEVDIESVLDYLNSKNQQMLSWWTSIVDLMTLVGMSADFQLRRELAVELGYPDDTSDSVAMNIWLHTAVMKKLAQVGGKVPAAPQR
jgi:Domain of unknown function (DUF3597)